MSSSHSNPGEKARFLESLKSATSPVVDANSLYFTPEELNQLVAMLRRDRRDATELNLNLNALGNPVIEVIIILAQNNLNLKTYKCQYNEVDDEGVAKLIQAAEGIPRILEIDIDLSCNKITKKSLNHIGKLSPLSILSALNGNLIENSPEVENLRKQAQERYASGRTAFFSKSPSQPQASEENKLEVIQKQISELSPSSRQRLIESLNQTYKPEDPKSPVVASH